MRTVLFAGAVALAGCGGGGDSGNEANVADDPVLNLPAVPLPQPPLDRSALLASVAKAASAAASGQADPAAQRALDGRQFELRIRFGCRGPVPEGEQRWLGWSFDTEERRLRVEARPTITGEDPIIETLALPAFEAVEGFWIPRPWLLQPACPAAAVQLPAAATAEEGQAAEEPQAAKEAEAADGRQPAPAEPQVRAPRVGLAEFFTEADPRSARRDGRPYQFVRTLEEGTALGSDGYTLVLAGRLRALPGKGVILCSVRGPDVPPDCLVSADFDRVWIERPDNGEMIAEWRTS